MTGPNDYSSEALRLACEGRSGLHNDENYCLGAGMGNARLAVWVRAMDPAGNMAYTFSENGNQFTWTYEHPLPILEIAIVVVATMIGLVAVYLEIRRQRRKKAMERYAMKRMRRKFKGMQKDADKGSKKK